MTTTLSEGVKVPDVGSTNWAGDLEVNWNLLNGALANLSGNVKTNIANTWTAEQTFSLPIVGSITGTASKAVADADGNTISSTYGKLAGSQTWTGTNSFHNLNPEANSTYSLGTSSYRWSSVYADSYYYGTTAWGLDKANVWTEANTFSNYITLKESAAILAGGYGKGIAFRDYQNNRLGYIQPYLTANSEKRLLIGADSGDIASNSNIIPNVTNSLNLGTSTNKWSSINGINPGALSLPDAGNAVSIDTTNWDVAAGYGNRYTPVSNGWLHINIKDTATNSIFVYAQNSYSASVYGNGSQGLTGRLALMMPVLSGVTYEIIITAGSVSEIYEAKYFPCLGNV